MEGPRGAVGFGQLCSKAEAEGRAEERAAMLGMASPPRVAEARGSVGLPGDQRWPRGGGCWHGIGLGPGQRDHSSGNQEVIDHWLPKEG